MFKKLAALALGLFLSVVPANAGTLTSNFQPFPGSPPHTISGNGISVTFGDTWTIAADNDLQPPPPPHLAITGGMFGNFAGEGPTNYALYHAPCDVWGCPVEAVLWKFEPLVNSITFEYTGSLYQQWYDEGWHVTDGQLPYHIYILYFYDGVYYLVDELIGPPSFSGRTPITYANGWTEGSPCSGDPTGDYCNWDTFSYSSTIPFSHIYIGTEGYWGSPPAGPATGFWIRNFSVSNGTCPDPPCGFERATPTTRTSWGRLKTIYR